MNLLITIGALAVFGLSIWLLPWLMTGIAWVVGAEKATWTRAFALIIVLLIVGAIFAALQQAMLLSGVALLFSNLILIALNGVIAAAILETGFLRGTAIVALFNIAFLIIAAVIIGLLMLLGTPAIGGPMSIGVF